MTAFDSLTLALDGWFESPACDLPDALRLRVEKAFSLLAWDDLNAEHRRSFALQRDQQNDPAMAQTNAFWFDFPERKAKLELQIAEWQASTASTAAELALRESRLMELHRELASMGHQERMDQRVYEPTPQIPAKQSEPESTSRRKPLNYLPYPRALRLLTDRLNTTPEEIAAWVWFGPDCDGICAYKNANELDAPPRFFFDFGYGRVDNHDYVSPLMACWFSADEIAQFKPTHRYITGAALLQRWCGQPGLKPVAFIQAKIRESRLLDAHPIYGMTQASHPEDESQPPLETALFRLSDVEDIEAEDFGVEPALEGSEAMTAPETDPQHPTPQAPALSNVADPRDASPTTPEPVAGASGQSDRDHKAAAPPENPAIGSEEWRRQKARAAANAMHDKPGGSRDKRRQIREIWARGNYSDRDTCAEQECAALGMPYSTARKALRNTAEPARPSAGLSTG